MKNEYKNIIRAEVVKKESKYKKIVENIIDRIYEVFFYILKNPLDNIYWECISLITQYLQLIIFVLDESVSIQFLKNIVYEFI